MGPLAALDEVCRRFCGRTGHDDVCLVFRRVLHDASHAAEITRESTEVEH